MLVWIKQNRTAVMVGAAILLVAAVLRLNRLDLIDYRFDQAYPLQYALDIVSGRTLWGAQPHGSVGAHPPAYLYVIALAYVFTKKFIAIIAYRVLLDVLGVGLCWLIGARYFNMRAGLMAAALYAIGPWAIQFARITWPVPQPVFSALLLIGLLEMTARRNSWGWAIAGWGIALVAGVHMGGEYILPVVLIGLWMGRRSFKLAPALVGLLPIVAVAALFLSHEAAHNFEDIRGYLAALSEPATFSTKVIYNVLKLSGGFEIGDLSGKSFELWYDGVVSRSWFLLDDFQRAWFALSFVGIFAASIWFVARRKSGFWQNALLICLWVFIPVILQLRTTRPVAIQYMPVVLPAPFLLMALLADQLLRLSVSRAVRIPITLIVSCAFAVVMGWQVFTTLRFTDFVNTHVTTGVPVRAALETHDMAQETISQKQASDVTLVIHDFPTPWNEQATIMRTVNADVPYRFLNSDGDGFTYRAQGGTQFIFTPGAQPMLERVLAQARLTSSQIMSIETAPGSGVWYAYLRLNQPLGLDGFSSAPHAVFDSGVSLDQVRMTYPAPEQLHVEVILNVDKTPPENVDYHWYIHAFEGDAKIGQTDIAGVHPSSWRAGDKIFLAFDLAAPPVAQPSARFIRLGSYTFPDVKPVMATLPSQAPAGNIVLPLPK